MRCTPRHTSYTHQGKKGNFLLESNRRILLTDVSLSLLSITLTNRAIIGSLSPWILEIIIQKSTEVLWCCQNCLVHHKFWKQHFRAQVSSSCKLKLVPMDRCNKHTDGYSQNSCFCKLVIQSLELLSGSQRLFWLPEWFPGLLIDLMMLCRTRTWIWIQTSSKGTFWWKLVIGKSHICLECSIIPSWFSTPLWHQTQMGC